MVFGSTLKNLRIQRGLSQNDISEKLYVVRQTVSKWENGLSSPSVEQLIRLSTLLDAPINLLLGINDEFAEQRKNAEQSIAVTPKEEMITTIANRLEGMNETGVKVLFDIVMLVPDRERWMATTSPERIAELEAIRAQREHEEAIEKEKAAEEARQTEAAKRDQIYLDHARMFNAIKTIDVPARYDLCVGEIWAIDFVCGGIRQWFPEYAYSVASKYFNYGFVKGVRYAKAQAKKKQKGEKLNKSM